MGFVAFLLGFLIYGLWVARACFFRVDEGSLAVLTRFGAAEFVPGTKRLHTYGPGLHPKAPWDRALHVSMKEQSLDLSGEHGGLLAMASDGTVLRLDTVLRYVPDEADLAHFLFGMKDPLTHITRLFSCLVRNKIANFRATDADSVPEGTSVLSHVRSDGSDGSYAMIRGERQLLSERIESFCKEHIGQRYGVRFYGVDIVDILAPDELAEALNAVINASSEAERAYYRAEAACQARVVGAEEGVAIAAMRAKAMHSEIVTLGNFLQAEHVRGELATYVRRRRAEVFAESRTLYVKESVIQHGTRVGAPQ